MKSISADARLHQSGEARLVNADGEQKGLAHGNLLTRKNQHDRDEMSDR